MRQGAAKTQSISGHSWATDWDEDADTTYQQRPGAGFSPSPRLSVEDDAWAPESPIRLMPPATAQRFAPRVCLPATEFGREFGYRRKRRSGRGQLWLVACAMVLAAIALARVPRVQSEIDKLGTLADRLGITGALARLAPNVLTRTRTAEPPAPNLDTPVAPIPASSATDANPGPPATPGSTRETGQGPARSATPEPSSVEPFSDEPRSATPDADGVLRINSLPWAEVSIDGNWVGTTPQREIKLRPGRHKVKLVNPDMRLVRMFAVRIEAGQTVTKSVLLQP